MSNAARTQIPTTGDDGKSFVYDEANDEWDLSSGPLALDSALTDHSTATTSVHGITDTSALVTTSTSLGGDLTGTVGNAQIAAGAVGATELASDAVTNAKVADDAIGIAELSATGTPSSSTFLRGDNSWATPSGGGSGAIAELQNPEEGWDGTGSQTWIIPAFAGTLIGAANEWAGGPFTFAPYYIYESMTLDQVRLTVTGAAAGSTVRLAMYAASAGGWPTGAPVHDFGTIDTSSTGTKLLTGSWALTAGRYWVAVWYSSQSVSIVVGNPWYGFIAGAPDSAYETSAQVRTPWPRPTTAFHATNSFPTLGGASPQTPGSNNSTIVPFVSLRRSA